MTLDCIKDIAATCTLCELHKNRIQPVFAKGDHSSRIMVCGMVPAHEENAVGIPFVGRAGKLLNKILSDSGIDNPYITNIVKCCLSPGIKLSADWIDHCIPYLINQIGVIRPRVILTLGSDASNGLLGTNNLQMSQLRGKVFEYSANISVLPTYHPSYLLRGGAEKHRHYQTVVDDFIRGKSIEGDI